MYVHQQIIIITNSLSCALKNKNGAVEDRKEGESGDKLITANWASLFLILGNYPTNVIKMKSNELNHSSTKL